VERPCLLTTKIGGETLKVGILNSTDYKWSFLGFGLRSNSGWILTGIFYTVFFRTFAHGGFLVTGGYICYYMLTLTNNNIWVAGALSLIGAGLSAIATERLAYKPIREKTNLTLYLLIASMGMSIVIENFWVIMAGGRFRALPPVIPTYPIRIGSITISFFDILVFLITIAFLTGLEFFLQRTRWGLAIRAAAYDLRVAGLMGVNVNKLISLVFFLVLGFLQQ